MIGLLKRLRLRSPIYLKYDGPFALKPGQRLLMVMENPPDSGTRLEFGATWIEVPIITGEGS